MKKQNPILQLTACAAAFLSVVTCATAADLYKADNSDSLELASSWTNNAAPAPGDNLFWDATVTAANTTNTVPGFELNVNSLKVLNPAGPIVIDGTGPLSVNQFDGLSQSTSWAQDITFNCPVSFTGSGYKKIILNAGKTMIFNGNVVMPQVQLDGDAGANSVNAQLRFAGSGFGMGTESAGVQFKSSAANLGVGSSSTYQGGPLGTNTFTWAAGDRYLFAFNGSQVLSNAVATLNGNRIFGGSNNLTLASMINFGNSRRLINNIGNGTLILTYTNGSLQVTNGKIALTGTSYNANNNGVVQNTGTLIFQTPGEVKSFRYRQTGGGSLGVKVTAPDTQFVLNQLDNDTGPVGSFTWDFTGVAPSTTVAPLKVITNGTSLGLNVPQSSTIVLGSASSFTLATYPLIEYVGSVNNPLTLTTNPLVLPTGLAGYLTNDTVAKQFQLVITSTNSGATPPVFTQHPGNKSAYEGGNVTFTVLATGANSYQWYSIISGVTNSLANQTNASYTITGVTFANAGDYYATASNGAGTVASDLGTLTVATPPVVDNAVFWIGGTANNDPANLNNYRTNSAGLGSAPASLAGKVVEYVAYAGVLSQTMNASSNTTFGAFHSNTNRAGGYNTGFNDAGIWTLTRATVSGVEGTINNAAVVVDNGIGGGWRIGANLELSGGGDFVFAWNNGNDGSLNGDLTESGGAANLIFQGAGGSWKLEAGNTMTISGNIIIRGVNCKAQWDYDWDISSGTGVLSVDPNNEGAKLDLGKVRNYTVKYLVCGGTTGLAAGTYTSGDLITAGVGGYFLSSGATIVVTVGGLPGGGGGTPTGCTIASATVAGNILSLSITNGLTNGVFNLLQSPNIQFNPFTTNQSGSFDSSGNAGVTVTNTGSNGFLRVAEPAP